MAKSKKTSKNTTGGPLSDATKAKISAALKGLIPWNKGKKTGVEPWNKGMGAKSKKATGTGKPAGKSTGKKRGRPANKKTSTK